MGDTTSPDQLEMLLEQFLDGVRAGDAPDVDAYAAEHAQHAEQLKELLPTLLAMENLAPNSEPTAPLEPPRLRELDVEQVGDYRILREIGRGGMGIVYEAEQSTLGRHVALKVLARGSVDDRFVQRFRREARAAANLHHTNIVPVYDVGEEDGTLFYAMQFICGAGLDQVIGELRRLRAEDGQDSSGRNGTQPPTKQSTGSGGKPSPDEPPAADSSLTSLSFHLWNGSILPDHDHEALTECVVDDPDYARQVARIGAQIAEALDYAHGKGILHRDIKPANILLDMGGTAWLADFGLAKSRTEDDLTHTGDIIGTIRYMAPESFQNHTDRRSEVYALGITLYELLTLQPAFDAPHRHGLIQAICEKSPRRLRAINPVIPADLEKILEKSFDRESAARYSTAGEFAADLERFVNNEPVLARRISVRERWLRWARRNKALAVSLTTVALLLLMLTVGSLVVSGRLNQSVNELTQSQGEIKEKAKQLEQQSAEANRQRELAQQHLYATQIALAENRLQSGDAVNAERALQAAAPKQTGDPDRRGWEWHYLNRWLHGYEWSIENNSTDETQYVHAIAMSRDDRFLASSAGGDPYALSHGRPQIPGDILIRDFATGRILHRLEGHVGVVRHMEFSPDGNLLATAGMDQKIIFWSTQTGKQAGMIDGAEHTPGLFVKQLQFSPDGRQLLAIWKERRYTYLAGGPAVLYSVADKRPLFTENLRTAAFDRNGKLFAVSAEDGRMIYLWDPKAGKFDEWLPNRLGNLHTLITSAHRRHLAAVSESQVLVWDIKKRQLVRSFNAPNVHKLTFNADETRICASGRGTVAQTWNTVVGAKVSTLLRQSAFTDTAYSANGRWLAVAGASDAIQVFRADADPRGLAITTGLPQMCAFAFLPDGTRQRGVTWNAIPRQREWEIETGGVSSDQTFDHAGARYWPRRDFAYTSDGKRLAAPRSPDGKAIAIRDAEQPTTRLVQLEEQEGAVSAVAFSADDKLLATACSHDDAAILRIWNADTGERLHSHLTGDVKLHAMAFHPDGGLIAVAGTGADSKSRVSVWNIETWESVAKFPTDNPTLGLAYAPDGKRLAATDSLAGRIHLWTLADESLSERATNLQSASDVAWSPDGARLAVISRTANVHLFDPDTLQELITLRAMGPPAGTLGYTPRVKFSPDGNTICGNSPHGILTLWKAGSGLVNQAMQKSLAVARSHHARGEFDRAIAAARQVVENEIENRDAKVLRAEAYELLADCREQTGEDEAAEDARSLGRKLREQVITEDAAKRSAGFQPSLLGIRQKVHGDATDPGLKVVSAKEAFTSPDWIWTTEIPIGPFINTQTMETQPTLYDNDKVLLYASNRKDGRGGFDIWTSQKSEETGLWSRPTNLGPPINTPGNESRPAVSADGLMLIYESDRGDRVRSLLVSTRPTVSSPWQEPVLIPGAIPRTAKNPYLTPDKLRLYFSAHQPRPSDGGHDFDLFVSQRDAVDQPWPEPRNLGARINAPRVQEFAPTVSPDGLMLMYVLAFPGGRKLMLCTRESPTAEWSDPVNLKDMNYAHYPWLSADGRTVFYRGGHKELLRIRRVPGPSYRRRSVR